MLSVAILAQGPIFGSGLKLGILGWWVYLPTNQLAQGSAYKLFVLVAFVHSFPFQHPYHNSSLWCEILLAAVDLLHQGILKVFWKILAVPL